MLRNGTKLSGVRWQSPGPPENLLVGEGAYDAQSIEVVMQNGQMAEVPWALAIMNNGSRLLINLALVAHVILEEE